MQPNMVDVPKCINPKYLDQDCDKHCFLRSRLEGRAETITQISELRVLAELPRFNPAPRSTVNPADLVDQLTSRLASTDRTIASFRRECEFERQNRL